jgi:hypothetical protein
MSAQANEPLLKVRLRPYIEPGVLFPGVNHPKLMEFAEAQTIAWRNALVEVLSN